MGAYPTPDGPGLERLVREVGDLRTELRDLQRPTGTQLQSTSATAQTAVSNAATANSLAVAAQGTANTAATTAAAAQTTAASATVAAETATTIANGKNRIVFSPTADASGTGYAEGDLWLRTTAGVIVGQWEFTAGVWASRTVSNLSATALDGKTITGALIRTAASGARVELTTAGLKGYDAGGVVKTAVGTDGALTASGANIAGAITATSGTFSGDISVTGKLIGTRTTHPTRPQWFELWQWGLYFYGDNPERGTRAGIGSITQQASDSATGGCIRVEGLSNDGAGYGAIYLGGAPATGGAGGPGVNVSGDMYLGGTDVLYTYRIKPHPATPNNINIGIPTSTTTVDGSLLVGTTSIGKEAVGAFAYSTNWSNSPSTGGAKVSKMNGVVHLAIAFSKTVDLPNGTIDAMATLPVGYRPSAFKLLPCIVDGTSVTGGGLGQIQITAAGLISVINLAGTGRRQVFADVSFVPA